MKTLESKETRASKKTTVTHNSVFAAHRLQCRMTNRKIDIRHFVSSEANQAARDAKQRPGFQSRKAGKDLIFSQPSTINSKLFQRGHSSVGRAPALQAGSQGFESPCLQSLKGVEAKSNKKGNIVGCASGSVIPLPPAPKAFGAVAP